MSGDEEDVIGCFDERVWLKEWGQRRADGIGPPGIGTNIGYCKDLISGVANLFGAPDGIAFGGGCPSHVEKLSQLLYTLKPLSARS